MMSNEWLYIKGKRVTGRVVKVRSGLDIMRRMHKAPGRLIRADFAVDDGRFVDVSISGDFFCFPKDTIDQLTSSLEGCPTDEVFTVLTDFYSKQDFEMPEVTVDDWMQILKI